MENQCNLEGIREHRLGSHQPARSRGSHYAALEDQDIMETVTGETFEHEIVGTKSQQADLAAGQVLRDGVMEDLTLDEEAID